MFHTVCHSVGRAGFRQCHHLFQDFPKRGRKRSLTGLRVHDLFQKRTTANLERCAENTTYSLSPKAAFISRTLRRRFTGGGSRRPAACLSRGLSRAKLPRGDHAVSSNHPTHVTSIHAVVEGSPAPSARP